MPYINIENIQKTFNQGTNREFTALKEISILGNEGDFIVIIGGNGAGKSTLLNSITGLFTLDSGKIYLDDIDIINKKTHERAEYISRVFQNPFDGTAPRMTVLENLLLAMKRGERRLFNLSLSRKNIEYIKEKLIKFNLGLEEKLNTEMQSLSGGQRQIISLLMATIKKPKLLLLDEHISALDPVMQEKVMELTDEIIKEHKLTAIMITHKLSDALKYGNRLIIMNRGRVIKDFNEEEKKQIKIEELYEFINK